MKRVPKYQHILERLTIEIISGKYKVGQKFPSEAALVQRFATSRITVGRALRELTERGLVERRAGSGTYVRPQLPPKHGALFGLLIPNLGETEIFEPICQGIAGSPLMANHALLWGHADPNEPSREKQALRLCEQFIARKASGVFFAPVEGEGRAPRANAAIVSRLENAGIPVVLLDRCVLEYPDRSHHDLVGIDNRRAGYIATRHLLKLEARRVAFLALSHAAPTVDARIAGYREAHRKPPDRSLVLRLPSVTTSTIAALHRSLKPDAYVCANDRTAGELMHALQAIGLRIPDQVRIVGIDDIEYARLLPVPLTTIRQPCRSIGEAALAAMLDRIARPAMPARDILIECTLVVRDSCGARRR